MVILARRATPAPVAHALVELVPTTARTDRARYVLDLGCARLEFDDLCSAETLQRVVSAVRAC